MDDNNILNIEYEELDWSELVDKSGMLTNHYDELGNWWLMFVTDYKGEQTVYVLDFKPKEVHDGHG